jgi:hypothetical protein
VVDGRIRSSDHVGESLCIVPHSAIASFATRCATAGLSRAAGTTSTGRLRISLSSRSRPTRARPRPHRRRDRRGCRHRSTRSPHRGRHCRTRAHLSPRAVGQRRGSLGDADATAVRSVRPVGRALRPVPVRPRSTRRGLSLDPPTRLW